MNKVRIAFAGGRELGIKTLEWLCEQPWADVVTVCTLSETFDPKYYAPMSHLLEKYSIKTCDIDGLKNISFELGLSVNYNKIISPDILDIPSKGFYNVHHSYNLRLKGRNITTHAILCSRYDNIYYHGTTLHKMVPELDAGPIVASYSCPILPDDTAECLFKRVDDLAFDMLKEWLPRVATQTVYCYQPPQEGWHSFKNKDLPSKEATIDDLSSDGLWDLVRAFDFTGYEPFCIIKEHERIPLVIKRRGEYEREINLLGRVFYTKNE